jgi:hypothetical protein
METSNSQSEVIAVYSGFMDMEVNKLQYTINSPSTTGWISVFIPDSMKDCDDIDLANFIIQRLKYQEAHMAIARVSRQRCQSNWVSFPIADTGMGVEMAFAWAVHIVQLHLSEIVNNKKTIDREYLFGLRASFRKHAEAYDLQPDIYIEGWREKFASLYPWW